MKLWDLKALIVTRRLKKQDCSALVVMRDDIERELCKRSQLQRILDDPAAVDRLCMDDKALEELLGDIGPCKNRGWQNYT